MGKPEAEEPDNNWEIRLYYFFEDLNFLPTNSSSDTSRALASFVIVLIRGSMLILFSILINALQEMFAFLARAS